MGRRLHFAIALTVVSLACGLDVVGVAPDIGSVTDSGAPTPDAPAPVVDAGRDVEVVVPVCASDAVFTSDPRNCGACGHDCLGGACVAGACQPFLVASNLNGPYAIASDGTLLYVSLYEDRRIVSCPLSGCAASPKSVVTTIGDGPTTIATANGILYWALYNSGDLYSCTLPACTDPLRIHMGGIAGADPGTIHGGALFISSFKAPTNVVRCTLPACTKYDDVFKGDAPDGVAVSDTWIFISEFNLGTILRCPTSGCPPTPPPFASGQGGPTGAAVDATRVYWANNKVGMGAIMTCPIDGCGTTGPTALVPNEERALGVVVDDKRVVWTTWQTPGTVRAIAK